MKIEAWIVAIVASGTGEQPWAQVAASHHAALDVVTTAYQFRLEDLTDAQLRDTEDVRNALDQIAEFTIEPVIIDTDELASR